MRIPHLFAAALVAAAAACSHDAATATEPTSPGTSTSSSGVTITVDTAIKNIGVPVGTAILVQVHVLQAGAVVPNTPVTWAVTGGGGTIPFTLSVSDSTGVASVIWTVGDTVEANTLNATITGATVVVTATTVAGPVSSLVKVSPDSQSVVAGALLTLTARAVDRFGNGVDSATINWSTVGGSLSSTTTPSGVTGNATTNLATDSAPATALVTAALPGKASVTFKVVGL